MATSTSNSNTISGQIKWTGLASGTDFKQIVEQLMLKEQRTVNRQQTWQSQWKEKLNAITSLDNRLQALKYNAQDYDTREELLSRKSSSSKEDVATISNVSTAPEGVYKVTVGEKIREKIASRSFHDSTAIGASLYKDKDGNPINGSGELIGAKKYDDQNVLKFVKSKVSGNPDVTYQDDGLGNKAYYNGSTKVASVNSSGEIILEDGNSTVIATHNGTAIVKKDDNKVIPSSDPADFIHQPITITMGGKTLTLQYDASKAPGTAGYYNENYLMKDLATAINATVAADPDNMPKISAEIVFDKKRKDDGLNYSRLVITGKEGGKANHITVSDPTNLNMDENSIDPPVLNSWIVSGAQPKISAESKYTGNINKTITFVASNSGTLGKDKIEIKWADTEGHTGQFTINPEDWDATEKKLKKDVEIMQGLKINFNPGKNDNGLIVKSEAFTIDCQNPLMQQAADSGLAQSDKWVHKGVADMTSPVTKGTGTFVYYFGGTEYTVKVGDTKGLSGLVEAINSDPKNPGVTASILNDGMGTATSYKLVLTGNRVGQEYAIRISDKTNLNQIDCKPEDFSHAREATNSMSRIDGYPDDGVTWIQRPTNEVGDVLEGIIIQLQGVGDTQITVTNDVKGMADKIKQLIESVNFCKTEIQKHTKFGKGKLISKVLKDGTFVRETEQGKEPSGVMIGNYGFQMAQSTLDRLMTRQIFTQSEYIKMMDEGKKDNEKIANKTPEEQKKLFEEYLQDNGLLYTRLSDIGIASNPSKEGESVYVVEESKLTEALRKNPEAVIKLFTFKPEKTHLYKKYPDEEGRPPIGGFAVNMGYSMSDLTRNTDVIDSKTGQVIQPAKGIMKVLAENYTNIISGIDKKIDRENKRLDMVRSRLEKKFNRLEKTIDTLNKQSKKVEAQLAKLKTNNN